jgi:spermidine synthase
VVIVPGDPLLRTVAGRLAPGARVLFHREDAAATVTVVDTGTARNVLVNGLHVSGTGAGNRIPFVGVPTAFVPAPKRMLMVGLGAAEAAYGAQEQGLEVTVAELVPAMVEATRFTQPERPSLRDSGIRVILTDGRNFVLRTHEQFDVILVDISPPIFSSGAANLYSREFLELARGRLSEDGVMALWLPAVCFADDIWRVAAGFVSVFPEAIIWAQPRTAGALFLGARRDGALDASSPLLEARLRERGLAYPDGGAFDADCLRRGVVIGPAALRAFVAGFPPLTDDRPYTEFPLARFIRGERLWLDNLYLVQASQPVSTPPLPAVRQGVAPR